MKNFIKGYFKLSAQYAFLVIFWYLISCSSTAPVENDDQKPNWISNHSIDQYVGIGQAASEDVAKAKAVNHALSAIRLSIFGGNISSLVEMAQFETQYEYDETFKAFSKLSISGYVKATELSSYSERDFDGDDLIFRTYVLMAFDREEYTEWLLAQIEVIKKLIDDVEKSAQNYKTPLSHSDIVQLFTYLELATENFSKLEENGKNSVYANDIGNLRHKLEKLVMNSIDKIELDRKITSLYINPFFEAETQSDLRFIDQDGNPISNFPYLIVDSAHPKKQTVALTDKMGKISVSILKNQKPGSIIKYRVMPAIHSVSRTNLPYSNIELIFKYPLKVDVQLSDDEGVLGGRDLGSELIKTLDSDVFVFDNELAVGGSLSGNVQFTNSSQTYGVYYVKAEIDLKLYTQTKSADFVNISFQVIEGGKSYKQATQNTYELVAYKIAHEIYTILGYSTE